MEKFCLTILVFLSGSTVQHHVGTASPLTYIVPSPDHPCPAENSPVTEHPEACLTLQQFFSKQFTHSKNGTVSNEINLQLLPGMHFLWMEPSGYIIFNRSSFIMKSDNATIICNHTSVQEKGFGFAYVQIEFIEVNGIQFVDCEYIGFSEVQLLHIENVIILNSHSWSISSVANATITRTSFLNGFALRVTSSFLQVKLSQFINSTTRSDCTDGGAIYFDGGSLYSSNSVLIVEQSIFKNNSAAGNNCSESGGGRGGAIFVRMGKSRVRISSCDFIGNRAALLGGALTAEGGPGSVEIFNSSFNSNSVGMCGGAIYYGVPFFSGNIVTEITDCDFNNNSAVMKGGALCFRASTWSNINISLLMSNFCHNAVSGESGEGGAAYIISRARSYSLSTSTISIVNSTFAHNSAPGNAGALHADVNTLLVQDSFFKSNRAGRNGGVVHVNTTSPITISVNQSTFSSNQAGGDGGVMFIKPFNVGRTGQSVVNIINSSFTFNVAIRSGGLITMIRSRLNITKGAQICCSNMANFGGVIKACDSEVEIQKELVIRDDPTDSQCILYDSLHLIAKTKSTTTVSYPQRSDSASRHLIAALIGITTVLSSFVLILFSIITCIVLYFRRVYWTKGETKIEDNSAHVYVPMNEIECT